MKLQTYILRIYGGNVKDFAEAIGCESISTIYRYLRGDRMPSHDMCFKIEGLTHGTVSHKDLWDTYQSKKGIRND